MLIEKVNYPRTSPMKASSLGASLYSIISPQVLVTKRRKESDRLISFFIALTFTLIIISILCPQRAMGAAVPFGYADPTFASPRFTARCYPLNCYSDSRGGLIWSFANGYTIGGVNGQRQGGVGRTSISGVADSSFGSGPTLRDALGIAIQADGRILVGASQSGDYAGNGVPNCRVFRLDTNGVVDSGYHSPSFDGLPRFMTVQADGKLVIGWGSVGSAGNGGLARTVRLMTDGSVDQTFHLPTIVGGPGNGIYGIPAIDGNGLIYLSGDIRSVDGVARLGLVRLLSDGTVDESFVPSGFNPYRNGGSSLTCVVPLPDGKVLIAGGLRLSNRTTDYPIIRLNSDGSVDPTFILNPSLSIGFFGSVRRIALVADGKILASNTSMARFNPDGSLDETFARLPFSNPGQEEAGASFVAPWFEVLPDGHIVIAGDPTGASPSKVGDFGIDGSVLLNPDGTVDPGYQPPTFEREVYPKVFQMPEDDSLVAAGEFDHANGLPVVGLARILPSGAIDPSFAPLQYDALTVSAFAPAGGGTDYLIARRSNSHSEIATNILFRLLPGGTVDTSFAPMFPNSGGFSDLVLQNQLLVISGADPQSILTGRLPIWRFRADGLADPAFAFTNGLLGATFGDQNLIIVGDIQLLRNSPNGDLLAAITTGPYSQLPPTFEYQITRLTAEGQVDTNYHGVHIGPAPALESFPSVFDSPFAPSGWTQYEVYSPQRIIAGAVDAGEGRSLIWGSFSNINNTPTTPLIRLFADGSLDGSFAIGLGPSISLKDNSAASITDVEVDSAGRLCVAGSFDRWAGRAVSGYLRLNPNGDIDPDFITQPIGCFEDWHGATTTHGFLLGKSNVVYLHGANLVPGEIWPRAVTRLIEYPSPSIAVDRLPNAQSLKLSFSLAAGIHYCVQTSGDLASWNNWKNIVGIIGRIELEDSLTDSGEAKYYRVVFAP